MWPSALMFFIAAIMVAVSSAGQALNGGYPPIDVRRPGSDTPTNGGYPVLSWPEGLDQRPVVVENGTDAWPPGTLPPLDYLPTPVDPRPPHVVGGLPGATVGVTGFDMRRATRFLWHSYASYCSVASIRAFNCRSCRNAAGNVNVTGVFNANGDSLQAYVLYDRSQNEIVVAFRGTANVENWLDNIKIWKANEPFLGIANARVAIGFLRDHKALIDSIVAAVKRARSAYPSAGVYATGHSLGGALAALSAFELSYSHGVPIQEVFTFGSPRIGNDAFARAYANRIPRTYRMSNNRDIVPHLPPMLFNFMHYDQEIWQQGSNYKECRRGSEDANCANSVPLPNSIHDHLHYMQFERSC